MPTYNFDFDMDVAGGMTNFTGLASNGLNNSNTVTADVEGTTDFTVSFAVSASSGNMGIDFIGLPNDLVVASSHTATMDLVAGTMANPYFSSINLTGIGGSSSYDIVFLDAVGATIASFDETDGASISYSAADVYGIRFTSNANNLQIENMSGEYNCFVAGTHIATPDGGLSVEDLQAGDTVLTADGSVATVSWLGVQPVNTLACNPLKAYPIRITAGALGNNLPARDLELSGDHAVEIDGLLFNASTLVNDTTIYQLREMPVEGFNYYHIELEEGNQLLLAEGLAAESYLDSCAWDGFTNSGDRMVRIVPEMPLMRISSSRLVPQRLRDALGLDDFVQLVA